MNSSARHASAQIVRNMVEDRAWLTSVELSGARRMVFQSIDQEVARCWQDDYSLCQDKSPNPEAYVDLRFQSVSLFPFASSSD